ncbi:GSCOCT00013817001.3-RA-CDS [Cotesia congregata]|uniref:Odorant receptor n=1 Tax=Cotesia congregata TaxID=51543 RepID=A0A8J2H7E9_COTCN|nr:GSCOCT00013817001.3-RA-CDS [Cotesia congregata]CAG5081939.1 olfactory receptor 86 [Cotesia congregata]
MFPRRSTEDQKDLKEGLKVFTWTMKTSKLIGLWPLAPNNFVFVITFVYFSTFMILEYMDLFFSITDIDQVLNNLFVNLTFTHIFIRGLLLKRHINKLGGVIEEMIQDFNVKTFKQSSEVKVFMSYINSARFFVKFTIIFMIMSIYPYFLKPLSAEQDLGKANQNTNETIEYILPYPTYVVFKINDSNTYMWTYMAYVPITYIHGCCHATVECTLITLIFYLRAKLVILAERINELNSIAGVWKIELENIITEHSKILKFGGTVIDAYSSSLMVYMLSASILVCIIGYKILLNFLTGPDSEVVQMVVYLCTTYLIISVFCVVSERLSAESNQISEAFWSCYWYDKPPKTVKNIIFCIARSQTPLALKIGKFSYFGNDTLTVLTKTSMGYLSVLRHFLMTE